MLSLIWNLQCMGGAFDPDTIDNWQIYNDAELVLSGLESTLGTNFSGAIVQKNLGDLEIKFNHDTKTAGLIRTVIVTDEYGKTLVSHKFTSDSLKMIIRRAEFGELTSRLLVLEYNERGNGRGAQWILGHIKLKQDSGFPYFDGPIFKFLFLRPIWPHMARVFLRRVTVCQVDHLELLAKDKSCACFNTTSTNFHP